MELILTGLSHKTAPIELRERFAIPREEIPRALSGFLHPPFALKEAVLLSTCNRVEVYGVSSDPEPSVGILDEFFAGLCRSADAKTSLYRKRGLEAVRHVFSVASGLDSMVVGESEVLGQVRAAYEAAVSGGTTGKLTNVLFQRALFVGKKVRTETGISKGATSIASVGVGLAQRIFGSLADRRVLILGAGKVAESAARRLLAQETSSIAVINRTHAKAVELARMFQGEVAPFESLPEEIERADIVICSTGSTTPIIRRSTIERVLPRRRGRSLYFIDVAVPRDVEPGVHSLDNVYVYDIDDLQGLVAENLGHRSRELSQARAVVEEAANEFSTWYQAIREGRTAALQHKSVPV
jgi:glutamyl-tRNA reductase